MFCKFNLLAALFNAVDNMLKVSLIVIRLLKLNFLEAYVDCYVILQANNMCLDESNSEHPLRCVDCNVILQANNMCLDESNSEHPLRFVLAGKSPSSTVQLTCQAPSDEIRQNWITQIRSILDMQGDIIKGVSCFLVLPMEIQMIKN